MPAIVDAHTHMPNERRALVNLLQRKAYYGVAAVISMGQDAGDLAFRFETRPSRAPPACEPPGAASPCRSPGARRFPIG